MDGGVRAVGHRPGHDVLVRVRVGDPVLQPGLVGCVAGLSYPWNVRMCNDQSYASLPDAGSGIAGSADSEVAPTAWIQCP
jgi:hypothetical protein